MENNNGNFLMKFNGNKDILGYIAEKLSILEVLDKKIDLVECSLNNRMDLLEINNKRDIREFLAEESEKNNQITNKEILIPFTQEMKKENDDVRKMICYKDKNKKWAANFIKDQLGIKVIKDAKADFDAIKQVFFAEATRKFGRNCTRWEDIPLNTETMRLLVDICREMIDILGRNKQEGFNINI